MTSPVNLTLTCYYFEIAPGCYVNNEVDSVTPYLTCYSKQRRHFEFAAIWRTRVLCLNFIILKLLLLSRGVNSPRLCYVNKDGVGVNDLPCKPNSNLLLSRDVNSPGYVMSTKMA